MAEGVPGGQGISGMSQAGRARSSSENGRGRQVFPRRDLSQSLQQAFQQSGVAATELYDFDADKAAFSSALDAARAFGRGGGRKKRTTEY